MKPEVLIQDYIRVMESPIQQMVYLKEVVAIAGRRPRLLQVLQTRMPTEDVADFETRLREWLRPCFKEFHVASFPGHEWEVRQWVIATGDETEDPFDEMCRAVRNDEDPEILAP